MSESTESLAAAGQDRGDDGAGPGGTTSVLPDSSPNGEDARPGGAVRGIIMMLREFVLVVVIALGLSLVIKTFFVQAFYIPSESMESTLLKGDRILVSKLTPGPFELRRGDVAVFKDPGGWLDPGVPENRGPVREVISQGLTFIGLLPSDSGQHLIKRVVGLPGDTVACCDAAGRVTVNGVAVQEPYVKEGSVPSEQTFSHVVPPGDLWVMGDNRQQSRDSRFNPNRPTVPVANVVGRAFVIVWPFDRMGLLDRPTDAFSGVPSR